MNLNTEKWEKMCDHCPNYYISNHGRVKRGGKIIKCKFHQGRHTVRLCMGGRGFEPERHTVARLVIYYFGNIDERYKYDDTDLYIVECIDKITTNYHISNLKYATRSQGMHLKNAESNGYYARGNKWVAIIKVDKKQMYLGTYESKEHARQAYQLASVKYFGEFSPYYKTGDTKIEPIRTTRSREQHSKNAKNKGYYARGNKWVAKIVVDKKQISLGTYGSKEYAHQAYQLASIKYFGEFSPYYKTGITKIKPIIIKKQIVNQ